MLFRSRRSFSLFEKLFKLIAAGWRLRRTLKYVIKRVLRLNATPHAIAAGVAAGVVASFTPFVGFHLVLSFLIALLIGGNFLAAAFGTLAGNPLTLPLMWAADFKLGLWFLGRELDTAFSLDLDFSFWSLSSLGESFRQLILVLEPIMIGMIPAGGVAGLLTYGLVHFLMRSYQTRRQQLSSLRLTKNASKKFSEFSEKLSERKTPCPESASQ